MAFYTYLKAFWRAMQKCVKDTAENITKNLLLWMWLYELCNWVIGNCFKLQTKYILENVQ